MVKQKITITIDTEILKQMKKICDDAGQKVSSVINILMHKFVMDSKDGSISLIKEEEKHK